MHNKFLMVFLAVLLSGCAQSQRVQPIAKSDISILPGAKVFTVAKVNSDGNIELTKIDKMVNSEVTLTFSFSEMKGGMMLVVKNPLDKTIKYHLNMIDSKGKVHNTSSCPVESGLSVYESWPHPISEIRVSNVHVASKDEEGKCVY